MALRFAPRWAVPSAFLTAAVVIGIRVATTDIAIDVDGLLPRVDLTVPAFTVADVLGIALRCTSSPWRRRTSRVWR